MPQVGIYGKLTIEQQSAINQMLAGLRSVTNQMSKTMSGVGQKVEQSLTKPLEKSHVAASKTYGYLKDVGRIVQGIFVSQVLYRGILQPIQSAVRELKDFMIQMEQTELAFKYLVGGSEAASAFVDAMEDFAAVTPFVMEDTTRLARYLLGVGFAAEDVIPMLTKVTDAMAILGTDPERLTNLVQALGKIKALGRATAREILSISRAGIPVFQILQEELGLTPEQIRNIGRMDIAGQTVIDAILNGIQRRFAGGAEDLSRTVGGLLSTIQDDLSLMAKDLFQGLYDNVQKYLGGVVDRLERLRQAMREGGVGALFRALFSPAMVESIKRFFGYMVGLGQAIRALVSSMMPLITEYRQLFFIVADALLPVITLFIKALATLIGLITQSTMGAKILVGALMGLAIAFRILHIAVNPVSGILSAIIGILAVVGLTSDWSTKKLGAFGTAVNKAMGIYSSQFLNVVGRAKKVGEEGAEGIGAVQTEFEDLENAIDSTNEKFKKFIAAFDEVYAIPEKEGPLSLEVNMGDLGDLGAILDMEELPEAPRMGKEAILSSLGNIIKGIYTEMGRMLWGLYSDIYKIITEQFIKLQTIIWKALGGFIGWLVKSIMGLGNALWTTISGLGSILIDAWVRLWTDVIIPAWQGFWEWLINTVIVGFLGQLGETISGLWDVITGETDFATWWEETKQGWIDWWNGVAGGFAEWVNSVSESIGIWYETTFQNLSSWWDRTKKSFATWWFETKMGFSTWWYETSHSISEWYTETIGKLTDWKNEAISQVGEFGRKWTIELGLWLRNSYPKVAEWILNTYESIGQWSKDTVGLVGDWGVDFLGAIGNVFGQIPGALLNIWDILMKIAKNMIDGVKSIFKSFIPEISWSGISFPETPLPTMKPIQPPKLASGGIVGRDQLIRVGEGNTPEMIQPLNEQTLRPFAQMIGGFISNIGTKESDSDYVLVKASKQDLTQLYRSLYVIKRKEEIRGLT